MQASCGSAASLIVRYRAYNERQSYLMKSIATVEELDVQTKVNLRGTYLCYKYAAKQMIKQGRGGRIIGKDFICAGYDHCLITWSQVLALLPV